MSLLDFEARNWISLYVTGQIQLADLRRWLLPAAWAMGQPGSSDSPVVRLAELRLAEYMNGHWTEDDLRSMFARIAPLTGGFPAVVRTPSVETVKIVRGTGLQGTLVPA